MDNYAIYCTGNQTKKAIELGAPIYSTCFNDNGIHQIFDKENRCYYDIPTAEEMIGWLEEQGVWIHFCKPNQRPTLLSFSISNINKPFRRVFVGGEFSTRKEATFAAIDAALEYLEEQKK